MKPVFCTVLALTFATSVVAQTRIDAHGDPLPEGAIARFGTVRYRVAAGGPYALSADGTTLAVESTTAVTLWDVETGKPGVRIPFASHRDSGSVPGPIALSPDGKYLVTVLHRNLRIWDTATGRLRIMRELPADGRNISFFPGTSHFAVTENDTRLWIFDVVTGSRVKAPEPEAAIEQLTRSGRYFFGVTDSIRHIVDARTGELRCKLLETKGHPEWPVEMSLDDRRVYSVTHNGELRTIDAETGAMLEELNEASDWAGFVGGQGLAISPKGDAAYVSRDGCLTRRRDLKAGKWLDPLPDMGEGRLIPHPDGKRVLFLGEDGLLRRYDLATLRELPPPDGFVALVSAYPSPNGRWIATQSGRHAPRLDMFDLAGRLVWSMEAEQASLPSWGPEGRFVVAGPRGIEFRDSATGRRNRELTAPDARRGRMPIVTFAGDQKRFVVCYEGEPVVHVFDTATGKRVGGGETDEHGGVPSVSPDGATMALGSHARGVCLLDTATGKVRVPWTDPPPHCTPKSEDALFSPDGSYLLDWDDQGVAVIRDPITARRKRSFNTSGEHVRVFAISPNGLWLATGSPEGMVSLWDVATGRQVWAQYGHNGEVTRVAFAGPGRLVTSSRDLTALLWDFTSDKTPTKPIWEALSGSDGLEAFRAVCALGADPHGPDLLRRKVGPATSARAEDVKRWIADLRADKFAVRETATKSLRELGRQIESDLMGARAVATSEEMRMRLDGLLAGIPRERIGIEVVQARAVAAMELAGTAAAKKLLAEWAAGASGARLTVDAKAALVRLSVH
jgi:WD40 repeat protein